MASWSSPGVVEHFCRAGADSRRLPDLGMHRKPRSVRPIQSFAGSPVGLLQVHGVAGLVCRESSGTTSERLDELMGGTLYGMVKTTVYLPDELENRLDAEAIATGVSKAELIRRGIAMLLDASDRPKNNAPLPVFHSGRSRNADEMDNAIYDHIKQQSARR
jgi:hypothetical protein